jgi:hypothetical protein
MIVNPFIPNNDAEFVNWLISFDQKLASHSATLGISAAEQAALHQDGLWMQFAVLQADLFKAESAERTTYKQTLRKGPVGTPVTPFPDLGTITLPASSPVAPGIESRVRALVQRLKNHPNYTEAIGQDLGIIPPAVTPPEIVKPTGKADPIPGCCAQVNFLKGSFTGVAVESRRSNQSEWEPLGIKHKPTFVDSRPPLTPNQPEVRSYRLRYISGDDQIGEWSDVFSATVAP